jgi:arylsulfatase A-like enzyme
MKPLVMFDGEAGEPLTESAVDFPKLTQRFFEQTLAFAEANRERPFFIYLALTAPHVPLDPNPDDLTGSPAGAYGEVVEEIDLNMGRLFEGLRRLGIEEDTLVVFTSDNGTVVRGLQRAVPRPQGRVGLGRRFPRAVRRAPAGDRAGGRGAHRAGEQPGPAADALPHGRGWSRRRWSSTGGT